MAPFAGFAGLVQALAIRAATSSASSEPTTCPPGVASSWSAIDETYTDTRTIGGTTTYLQPPPIITSIPAITTHVAVATPATTGPDAFNPWSLITYGGANITINMGPIYTVLGGTTTTYTNVGTSISLVCGGPQATSTHKP